MPQLLSFRNYIIISTLFFVSVLVHSFYKYEDFYPLIHHISTAKFAVAAIYNFVFMCFLSLGRIFLAVFVGQLRDLEVEQLIDNGRGFLMDTVLFLVLSNPTVEGQDVSTLAMMKFICFVVALKTFHLVLQIRATHMFEVGIPRSGVLLRLASLMFLLLFLDFCAVLYFYRHSSRASTLYLWLLFECLGMMASCTISVFKYAIHLIDIRMENGWASKSAIIFYLDLLNDVLSLGIFLIFMLIFFLNHPSRLPLYMTADIIQVVRTLYQRLRSFQKYRKLTRNMEQTFPDATLEELEEADTCIICRDILFKGSKKLPCAHVFHLDCLKSWLVQQQSCPTCRSEIIAENTNVPPTPQNNQQAEGGGVDAGGEGGGSEGEGGDGGATSPSGDRIPQRRTEKSLSESSPSNTSSEQTSFSSSSSGGSSSSAASSSSSNDEEEKREEKKNKNKYADMFTDDKKEKKKEKKTEKKKNFFFFNLPTISKNKNANNEDSKEDSNNNKNKEETSKNIFIKNKKQFKRTKFTKGSQGNKMQQTEEFQKKLQTLLQNMQHAYFMCEAYYKQSSHWIAEINRMKLQLLNEDEAGNLNSNNSNNNNNNNNINNSNNSSNIDGRSSSGGSGLPPPVDLASSSSSFFAGSPPFSAFSSSYPFISSAFPSPQNFNFSFSVPPLTPSIVMPHNNNNNNNNMSDINNTIGNNQPFLSMQNTTLPNPFSSSSSCFPVSTPPFLPAVLPFPYAPFSSSGSSSSSSPSSSSSSSPPSSSSPSSSSSSSVSPSSPLLSKANATQVEDKEKELARIRKEQADKWKKSKETP